MAILTFDQYEDYKKDIETEIAELEDKIPLLEDTGDRQL